MKRPDPEHYWLKPGDVIECEIENIGVMRNSVIAEELSEADQAWLDKRRHLWGEETE